MEVTAAPFRLTSFVWESQPGRYVLTAIAHGTARLAQGQESTWTTPDEYPLGYDDGQTLSARMNLIAPFKPRADVVVVGKAYAPPGGEADRAVARVRLGDFSKAVSVTGDRLWMKNEQGRWGSSLPRPFSQMLLSPERSIRSAENPVGLDPAGLPVEGRLSLPNLEPVAGSYSAMIGPVSPSAPSRRNLLTPHGITWVGALEMGHRPGPVSDGMNFSFFNIAPADQQLAEIVPGSAIVLENLHPAHSMFTSRLPTTVPRVRGTDPATGRHFEPVLRCDTVWIDGDRETAWLVFRGTVDLLRPDLPVMLSVEAERWQAPAQMPSLGTQTMLHTQTAATSSTPLPFGAQKGPSFGAYAQPEAHAAYSYAAPKSSRMRDENTEDLDEKGSYPPPPAPGAGAPPRRSITAEIVVEAKPSALPFGQEWDSATTGDLEITASSLPRQDTAEIESITPIHPTEPPPPPSVHGALPFAGERVAVAAEPPAPKRLVPRGSAGPVPDIGDTPQPELPAGLSDETARSPLSSRGPSVMMDVGPAPSSTTVVAPPRISRADAANPAADTQPGETIADEPTPPAPEPAPKALAVAAPEVHVAPRPPEPEISHEVEQPPPLRTHSATTDAPPPQAAPSQPSAPPMSLPEAPPQADEAPPAPVLRDAIALEEAAQIRAALAVKGADKAGVLAHHALDESAWSRLEREHLKTIDEGVRAGSNELLERYDDAFLAAQDSLRGPIDGVGYAKIQVARERGQLMTVLDELNIARGDLLRIDRVWRRRLATDRELAERVEDEMERLRDDGT